MAPNGVRSLVELIESSAGASRSIHLGDRTLSFGAPLAKTVLGGHFDALRGRRVVLTSSDQLQIAATMIELDGWARRMVICPPDLEARHMAAVIRDA
jgi:hypothetical protein